MRTIILASASPRRKQLLEQLGLKFSVEASSSPEIPGQTMEPHALARKLALDKASKVAARHEDALVIGADTLGVFRGRIIGKPQDAADACKILSELSGNCHMVVSGVALIDTRTGKRLVVSVETSVFLKTLAEEEIEAYVATGEPLDKAGAYAIQGLGAAIVEHVEGDYYNVVGLPLFTLCRMLKEFDINVF